MIKIYYIKISRVLFSIPISVVMSLSNSSQGTVGVHPRRFRQLGARLRTEGQQQFLDGWVPPNWTEGRLGAEAPKKMRWIVVICLILFDVPVEIEHCWHDMTWACVSHLSFFDHQGHQGHLGCFCFCGSRSQGSVSLGQRSQVWKLAGTEFRVSVMSKSNYVYNTLW